MTAQQTATILEDEVNVIVIPTKTIPQGLSACIMFNPDASLDDNVAEMTEAVGKKVVYLKRISMGVLTLPDDLKKGECRQLTAEEEKRLKESVVTK